MKTPLAVIAALFIAIPAQAQTWHNYGKFSEKNHGWVDMQSIVTRDDITYYMYGISDSKYDLPIKELTDGGNVNCKARTNSAGPYIHNHQEWQKYGGTKLDVNNAQNELLRLVCPKGTISPDFDAATKHM